MNKHLLSVSFFLLVAGLSYVVIRWPAGANKTFSQHVAPRRSSRLYYVLLFIIASPILYLYFSTYLVPQLHLPNLILVLVGFACITQIACTFVPETGGSKTQAHQLLAGISALSLLPVLALIAFYGLSGGVQLLVWVLVGLMIMIALMPVVFRNYKLPNLILQSVYYGLFFAALLSVTYLFQ